MTQLEAHSNGTRSSRAFETLFRLYGPWTIGTEAPSGCIRMLNEDVIDLYQHVPIGSLVVAL